MQDFHDIHCYLQNRAFEKKIVRQSFFTKKEIHYLSSQKFQ